MKDTWTPERIAKLRELWGTMTANQIAERFGVTRNAVIGKADRLGLRGPGPLAASKKPHGSKNRSPSRRAQTAHAAAERRAKAERPELKPVPKPEPIIIPQRTSNQVCRWPISDDRPWTFCEAPALVGKPYCPQHYARATVIKKP